MKNYDFIQVSMLCISRQLLMQKTTHAKIYRTMNWGNEVTEYIEQKIQ